MGREAAPNDKGKMSGEHGDRRPPFLYEFESHLQLRSSFRLFVDLPLFLLFLFALLLFLTLVFVLLAAFVTHSVHPFLSSIIISPQRATSQRNGLSQKR